MVTGEDGISCLRADARGCRRPCPRSWAPAHHLQKQAQLQRQAHYRRIRQAVLGKRGDAHCVGPWHTERDVTIAGLQAREFTFRSLPIPYGAGCQVSVHTRGLTDLVVLVWVPGRPQTMETPAHCDQAHRAADIVAKARVAAAGGSSWDRTPQTPAPTAITEADPCDLLTVAVDDDLPIPEQGLQRPALPAKVIRCRLRTASTEVTLRIVPGPLPRLPDTDRETRSAPDDSAGHRTTALALGMVPALTVRRLAGCNAIAEAAPDRLLRVDYSNRDAGDRVCEIAAIMLTRTLQKLLDETLI